MKRSIPLLTTLIAAVVLAACSTQPSSAPQHTKRVHPTMRLVAYAPSTPTAPVSAAASIRLAFSDSLAKTSPLPIVTPSTSGSWERLSPASITFVPTASLIPDTTYTVSVPPTLRSGASTITNPVVFSFHTAPISNLRIQEMLAQLDYLPLNFNQQDTSQPSSPADLAGDFSWKWNIPESITSNWSPGQSNVIEKGAIMRFQEVNHLVVDGVPGPQFTSALLAALRSNTHDPDPYNYVLVNKSLPQSLTLYSNGAPIFTAKVNTGIPGQDTASGTYPVYLRYAVTTMSGTNPDGSHYHDEGIPWTSYFNGGDALHGFIRPGYGWPQSLGCVEMSFADAGSVWPHTPLGTLVNVS